MSSLEGIRSVVVTRTLRDVQLLDLHGDGDGSLELNPVPETVPPEEGGDVGDEPFLHEAVTVKVGGRPVTLRQVGSPAQLNVLVKILFM